MSGDAKYIINKEKFLGCGSFATVFIGIKSDDGLQCAFKCASDFMQNEITIMKDLKHKNIIRFYDGLQYFDGFTSVICMEYCNQGSLFEFAEIHQGLCDNMFLKVLECLHQGMSYLRTKSLVHRDIKPGNMMVHLDNFGDFHVKLGDLGTAKKVADGATFQSICGTLEYLTPDLYIKYFEGLDTEIKVNADLWSMGVTLYHAAITQLPFIPFITSRATPETYSVLKNMYLNKGPGIISGRQNSERKDDITWSDSLPDSCQLSPMLNVLASKLIGNLMDRSDANTYERFFEEANRLTQKKRVQIFNSLTGKLEILYLDSLSYGSVSDQIALSTGHPKEDIIILTKDKKLLATSDVNEQCFKSLPNKGHLHHHLTKNTALVVVNRPITETPTLMSRHLPADDCNGPLERYQHFEDAKKYSEQIIKYLYQVGHNASYIDCQMDCYIAAAKSFNSFVLEDLRRSMREAMPWQLTTVEESCLMSESLITVSKKLMQITGDNDEEFATKIAKCHEDVEQLRCAAFMDKERWRRMDEHMYEGQRLLENIEGTLHEEEESVSHDNLHSLVQTAEFLANEMKMLSKNNVISKADMYKLEVWRRHLQLFECFQLSKAIFEDKSEELVKVHKSFFDWLKPSLQLMNDIMALRDSLLRHEETRQIVRTNFLEIFDNVQKMVQKLELHTARPGMPILELAEYNTIKARVYEINEIVEKLKMSQKRSV